MTTTAAHPAHPIAPPSGTPIADYALLSDCNSAALVDRAGNAETWPVPRQSVCVHPPGRVEDCRPFVVGLTATAAAPTPRATATPTRFVLPPTATRTPTRDPATPVTSTPSPTPNGSPTRTASPTPNTTQTPAARLWLPLGLRE